MRNLLCIGLCCSFLCAIDTIQQYDGSQNRSYTLQLIDGTSVHNEINTPKSLAILRNHNTWAVYNWKTKEMCKVPSHQVASDVQSLSPDALHQLCMNKRRYLLVKQLSDGTHKIYLRCRINGGREPIAQIARATTKIGIYGAAIGAATWYAVEATSGFEKIWHGTKEIFGFAAATGSEACKETTGAAGVAFEIGRDKALEKTSTAIGNQVAGKGFDIAYNTLKNSEAANTTAKAVVTNPDFLTSLSAHTSAWIAWANSFVEEAGEVAYNVGMAIPEPWCGG